MQRHHLISTLTDSLPSRGPRWRIRPRRLPAPRAQTFLKVQILHNFCTSVFVLASRWLSMHGSSTEYRVGCSILLYIRPPCDRTSSYTDPNKVTLGLCLIGAVPFARGGFVFIAQMLGAMASAGVVAALFPGPLAVTTSLSGGTSLAQGLFIELLLTAQLVLTVIMLAAEKHKSTFLAPIGIGLSLFIAELAGSYLAPFTPLPKNEMLTWHRSLLYWRISEPCQKLWPLRGKPLISQRALDLLDRPDSGSAPRSWFLLVHQSLPVRDCKPRSGFR